MKLLVAALALLTWAIYLHVTQLDDYYEKDDIINTDYSPTWLVQNPKLYTEAPGKIHEAMDEAKK